MVTPSLKSSPFDAVTASCPAKSAKQKLIKEYKEYIGNSKIVIILIIMATWINSIFEGQLFSLGIDWLHNKIRYRSEERLDWIIIKFIIFHPFWKIIYNLLCYFQVL